MFLFVLYLLSSEIKWVPRAASQRLQTFPKVFTSHQEMMAASLLLESNASWLYAKLTTVTEKMNDSIKAWKVIVFILFIYFFPFQLSDTAMAACLFVRQQLIIYMPVARLQSNTGL